MSIFLYEFVFFILWKGIQKSGRRRNVAEEHEAHYWENKPVMGLLGVSCQCWTAEATVWRWRAGNNNTMEKYEFTKVWGYSGSMCENFHPKPRTT